MSKKEYEQLCEEADNKVDQRFDTRTKQIVVEGVNRDDVINYLVEISFWFAVKPLPGDRWEISVKEKAYDIISDYVKNL